MNSKRVYLLFCALFVCIIFNQKGFSQNSLFYYNFNYNKSYVNIIHGKYLVEFIGNNLNDQILQNECGVNPLRLRSHIFIITDTINLTTSHKVFPTYITPFGSEMYVRDEILVKFKQNITQLEKDNIVNANGMTYVRSIASMEIYKSNNVLQTSINVFNSDKVIFCHPNFLVKPSFMGVPPNDPYFNKQFYLNNTGQVINDGNSGTNDADIDALEAWDISKGSSDVIVAVIDQGVSSDINDLPLTNQVVLPGSNCIYYSDPSVNPDDPTPSNSDEYHGTQCAGIIGALHNNNEGIAGIAPDCKIMPVKIDPSGGFWEASVFIEGIYFAQSHGAQISTNSWGFYEIDPNYIPGMVSAIEDVVSWGQTIVFAAGNSADHNHPTNPSNGYIVFPASCKVKGMMVAAASDRNDHQAGYSPINYIDNLALTVSAPSHKDYFDHYPYTEKPEIWTTDLSGNWGHNPWPPGLTTKFGVATGEVLPNSGPSFKNYSGRFGGTSAAAPQIAGVAALMLSVNPCITNKQIKEIIELTADRVGGYDYNWQPSIKPNYSKELGYGRLNAYNAVKAADHLHKVPLDLYIKDCDYDWGMIGPNYECNGWSDLSPDIWIRNTQAQPDFSSQGDLVFEDPEYSAGGVVYGYVRVRNRSCSPSLGTEELSLYWSIAATWQSWPGNWDGSQPGVGDKIGTLTIPVLQPGESIILEFPWTLPTSLAPGLGNSKPVCLLARIENSPSDPIILSPTGNYDVENNNNLALRNMTIVDNVLNFSYTNSEGNLVPIGKEILVGNPTNTPLNLNLKFESLDCDLAKVAEIHLFTNSEGYDLLTSSSSINQPNVSTTQDINEITIKKNTAILDNIMFEGNTRVPLYVGFNFLTDESYNNAEYKYRISQYEPNSEIPLGSENFVIRKYTRNHFEANAGSDKFVTLGNSVSIEAETVNENVVYNWYNSSNQLIHEGKILNISPLNSTIYKLEVISTKDGFKDYDSVSINVVKGSITSSFPNPVSSSLTINYSIEFATSASIQVTNSITGMIQIYPLTLSENHINIDFSNKPTGIYTVSLKCDDVVTDAIGITKIN